jgi:sulfur-carrier protein
VAETGPVPDGGADRVTVRYFAGARAAAGRTEETVAPGSIAAIRAELLGRHDARFARVLAASTLRNNATPVPDDAHIGGGAVIEVLPPFAGG